MNLYCAFGCATRTNWQELLPEPKKPGNIGEAKWLAEKLPTAWKKAQADAPYHFLAGEISNVVALNTDNLVYQGDPAGFVEFMKSEGGATGEVCIFALDATARMRQLLWTCVAGGLPVPFWLWTGCSENRYTDYQTKFASWQAPKLAAVDLESLSGSKGAKIPWNKWAAAWDVKPESGGDTWTDVHTAEVVRGLARRMGF